MAGSLDKVWTERDGPIARRVTAVVVGAGNRGENYASFALDFPSRMRIVGVAEPLEIRRAKFQARRDASCDMWIIKQPQVIEKNLWEWFRSN